MLEYTLEQSLNEQGYTCVCGVDEAGRGPLCGPVVAAACILPVGLYIEGLNDSKKLTPKKRKLIFDQIIENAIASAMQYAMAFSIIWSKISFLFFGVSFFESFKPSI